MIKRSNASVSTWWARYIFVWPRITFLCTSQLSYRLVLNRCFDRLYSCTLTAEKFPVSGHHTIWTKPVCRLLLTSTRSQRPQKKGSTIVDLIIYWKRHILTYHFVIWFLFFLLLLSLLFDERLRFDMLCENNWFFDCHSVFGLFDSSDCFSTLLKHEAGPRARVCLISKTNDGNGANVSHDARVLNKFLNRTPSDFRQQEFDIKPRTWKTVTVSRPEVIPAAHNDSRRPVRLSQR